MPTLLHRRLLNSILGKSSVAALAALGIWQGAAVTQAAVTAGGIAIIGYTDESNGGTDYFSVAALEEIAAGTTVYFTDNGWNSVDNRFRGTNDLTDGDGPETLIKLFFTNTVAAGTIMRSGFDDTGFEWTASGLIPGATTGNFDFLGLAAGGTGEQIYAFEASATLPLHNPTNHIFLLDMGDFNNPGFEPATSGGTGDLTPGLLQANNTAVSLPDNVSGDDADDFHNGSFALYMGSVDLGNGTAGYNLQTSGGTKAQWLAVIADSNNWLNLDYDGFNDVDAESQLGSLLNITPAPEPSRALLLALGGFAAVLRRRRK